MDDRIPHTSLLRDRRPTRSDDPARWDSTLVSDEDSSDDEVQIIDVLDDGGSGSDSDIEISGAGAQDDGAPVRDYSAELEMGFVEDEQVGGVLGSSRQAVAGPASPMYELPDPLAAVGEFEKVGRKQGKKRSTDPAEMPDKRHRIPRAVPKRDVPPAPLKPVKVRETAASDIYKRRPGNPDDAHGEDRLFDRYNLPRSKRADFVLAHIKVQDVQDGRNTIPLHRLEDAVGFPANGVPSSSPSNRSSMENEDDDPIILSSRARPPQQNINPSASRTSSSSSASTLASFSPFAAPLKRESTRLTSDEAGVGTSGAEGQRFTAAEKGKVDVIVLSDSSDENE
ncbi:hypothetical protein JCM8547_004787 [Rhodosporidiobolus lusitaniae]